MASTKKSQNIFAHSSSLQILWKCAGQQRLITKALINSASFKNIYKDVLQYVNSKTRRRSPLALILDSHLMIGLVYVYSKTVILCHQDVQKLYKDAVVHRFFEFEDSAKLKLTRKKDTVLTDTQWQIDIDENLLPDERMLLERDFSIEIPRQLTPPPPQLVQSPVCTILKFTIQLKHLFLISKDNLLLLPWEVSKPTHGKRITLLPDIDEPMPKFDIIDDRFGEPLPVPSTTAMDIDERYDRTFFRAAPEDQTKELLRAPHVDRQIHATDRYLHPSEDRTVDEHHPPRSIQSALPPISMPLMDTTSAEPEHSKIDKRDQFSIDALAFITSAIDTYPIYDSMSTKTVLLGADCIPSSSVPLIFVQEPTVIGTDEMIIPMDTLPPLDQQLPNEAPMPMIADAQVPDVVIVAPDEKKTFHISKKKRNTPNALNKKRKDSTLYEQIIEFEYDKLESVVEEEDEVFEKHKQEQKPWFTLVGRNGAKRMNKLLDNAKTVLTSTNLSVIIDDIMNVAKILTNPGEHDDLVQIRRTGQEMAIRRGQSSGLLPKSGTRSPSSIVPTAPERVSELPPRASDGDFLPPLPSSFDDLQLVLPPSEPSVNILQPFSPLQTKRRERTTAITPVEPSPTWQEKQKQKAIDDILNVADNLGGGSFNQFLKRSDTTRVHAARLFSVLLVLCGEGRLAVRQTQSYGEINIFINDTYRPVKQVTSDIESFSHIETMESDDSHF
ncbi:unnamed protein product [Rotaria magnacalcarata]|uniref:Uncharacterized protein n=2 Tax=Rotaria magnacalcarata TaxID=392030 RepID=A0A819LET0_9BILA|nr:unnamed protein product [Rotaria magnacalcarata]CAF1398221.1 unnamed protein product [Rotaria magnacalcarata]CAF2052663.1 unnamed protein product [Rotaria magnacalcarata]CAF2130081.1 unnamed protein product [Rotaria magnacalcarata]CAF3964865.1 unnamed protein product [Rotaria magnacalcarata]